jgi:N-acetylglucosaminyldiphosphoundecaprenol N-acetyl-beta-D-mannosaminyltransferase
VKEADADIFWCGISTPKQERFMAKYCGSLPVKLMVGVGAAFDVHSGRSKDAPDWIKDAGLHWLFRMIREPRRLAGRYLKNNPRFLWLTGLQLSGLKRYFVLEASNIQDAMLSLSAFAPLPASSSSHDGTRTLLNRLGSSR